MLTNAGFKVEKAADHFPKGTLDEEWLFVVGKKGWVVLSKDNRLRTNRLALNAIQKAKVAAFILTSCNTTGQINGQAFIKAHKRMINVLKSNPRPFIFTVTRDGKVKKYL